MTAQQLVASCQKRGITLFVRPTGRVGYRGPKETVTPKLLAVLGSYHDAIKKALMDEIAELVELAEPVNAHIAQCEFAALVNAVRAARARRMPSADKLDANYDESFNGIELRPGHFVWEPNKWFCCALERAYVLKDKYGAAWLERDPKRPHVDQDAQILVDDIETVVWWWYEWRLVRSEISVESAENCGSRACA